MNCNIKAGRPQESTVRSVTQVAEISTVRTAAAHPALPKPTPPEDTQPIMSANTRERPQSSRDRAGVLPRQRGPRFGEFERG
ncbi:hypothetical protein TOPH_00999 [Tolypocladium ophioglossoides CBS 100239]|uniref:Uncharacterized protein n=1 Tax=Tolypocladium ophioglossoides (strain CBS 100239) TaxID=1163406 RepID=A0A0L0NK74_TOLOC|nr:hypothetical protein TOPH_00999 [Tolypocladium ophioglossoides CBS 100239]